MPARTRRIPALLVLATLLACFVQPASAQTASPRATALPADLGMANVRSDFGAKGDGTSDDTAAIQRALDDGRDTDQDYYGRPKALFFPAGVYRVSATLEWRGCCVTLQGEGPEQSVIRLVDSAAGFGDVANPRPVIRTPDGNMSFRQNVWDLGVSTGSGNAGAVGLDYIANNSGALRNVAVRSEDGKGYAGVYLGRAWPGPCLLKDVRVEGFDYGIVAIHPEYGPTFENITLSGQRVAGILNDGNTLAIHTFDSTNGVPAIENKSASGMVIVLGATLRGGAAGTSAIENNGYLYARNVAAFGYASAIRTKGSAVPGTTVGEYVSGAISSLFDSPQRALALPIKETPSAPADDPAQWGKFTPSYYGDTSALQALLNSGKSTIYFPFGGYFSYNQRVVTVPATVRRIVGFSSIVNGDANGAGGGGIKFVVAENSAQPLIIEQFGYGVSVDHTSARTVAIKHGNYRYAAKAGAGELFLEDVEMADMRIPAGQRVWARQLNNESDHPKIVNNGGTLWILGLKTERAGTVIETLGGGKTELLGTLIYPSRPLSATEQGQAAFVSHESSQSLIYTTSVYCAGCGYVIQVEETRDGATRKLLSDGFNGRMALFVGYKEAPVAGSFRALLPLVRR